CSMYVMRVYYSCKIHKRTSFIALDEHPSSTRSRSAPSALRDAIKWDAPKPVQSQAVGYEAFNEFLTALRSDM
ncbi:hypothetical protein PHYSODRAFT_373753, partial [Phytophthora sojae]